MNFAQRAYEALEDHRKRELYLHFERLHYDEIDSTSLQATRLIESGEICEPTLITATKQTSGRGSRGRKWQSGLGNVYATYVFPVEPRQQNLHLIVYPISLATRQTIGQLLPGQKVMIKWPNDILVEGRKVSGSLHEVVRSRREAFFVAGIGVNVRNHPASEVQYDACDMSEFSSASLSADEVTNNLTRNIEEALATWDDGGFSRIREEYLVHAAALGKEMSISVSGSRDEAIRGIFSGIDDFGRLILEAEGGALTFATGTIFPSLNS